MPSTTISPLSLHDALPIFPRRQIPMQSSVHPVDEMLPAGKLTALGLQHVLVMYAGAVAVPLIVGRALNLPPEQVAHLISADLLDRKSTRLNSSHLGISYAVHHNLPPFPTRRSSDLPEETNPHAIFRSSRR